jgi:protein involved in polysaccharide export with SLBB domain
MNVSRCVLRSLKRGLRLLAVGAATFAFLAPASAQVPPNFDLNTLLQRAQTGGTNDTNAQQDMGAVQLYQPVIPVPVMSSPSRLEQIYSQRSGTELHQFGYDTLGVPMPVQVAQAGATQDNYILGIGDQVVIVLRGQENSTYSQRIDRNGQVILPKLPPIPAAGRRFGDFRDDLEARVAQAFVQTNAFVSLSEIRQVSVLVSGEVRAPGVRILSALSSPLDAILLSGGVNKTGSLRNVTVQSGGNSRNIDLYSVLTGNGANTLGTLHDGDRIYVPPLKNTVAVAGHVARPGIYELRGGDVASANQLMALAGGVEIPGAYQLSKMEVGADGRIQTASLPPDGVLHNGDILFVDVSRNVTVGRVTLSGGLQVEGVRARASGGTVGQLIHAGDLSPDAYPMFSVIVRRDPRSNAKDLVPFSLERVLAGQGDVALQDDDFIYVFTTAEERLLAKAAGGEPLTPAEIGCTDEEVKAGDAQRAANPTNGTPVAAAVTPGGLGGQVDLTCRSPQGGTAAAPGTLASSTALQQLSASLPAATQAQLAAVLGQQVNGAQAQSATPNGPAATASQAQVVPNPNYGPGAANGMAMDAYGRPIANYGPNGTQALSAPYLVNQPAPTPPPPSIRSIAQRLNVTPMALVRTVKDHVVWVLDSVRDPGPYLGSDGSTVESMVQAAGGLSREADLSSVEVTSTQIDAATGSARTLRSAYKATEADLRRVAILPLDVIRLRPVFSDSTNGRIAVDGEVRYPGTFDIVRGEKLSSVLERAGGLTAEAYPYGAVFTRERAVEEERMGNAREAKQLEADFATLLSMPTYATAAQGAAPYVTLMAQQLRDQAAVGRITITADPATLRTHPELDIAVEPGDKIVIPRRPTTVTVSGEVLNPGSFQFRGELTLRDYLQLSGGATQGSDEGRIFVVLPDGTARPAGQSWLTVSSTAVPPGSTIVVPRDLSPFDTMQFIKDVTQIGGQLAITAASLAVIGNN